jgi:hypothetical protein
MADCFHILGETELLSVTAVEVCVQAFKILRITHDIISRVQNVNIANNCKNSSVIYKRVNCLRVVTQWSSWLRHCGFDSLGGKLGFFHLLNPSGLTMAVGSTQPLTQMRSRSISWGAGGGGEGGRCVGLTTALLY